MTFQAYQDNTEPTNEMLFSLGAKILGESLLVEGNKRREHVGKLVIDYAETVAKPLKDKIGELETSLTEIEELRSKVSILGNKVDGYQKTLSAIGWEIDASTAYARQTYGDGPASTWELKNILIKDLVENAFNEQYPGNYVPPYTKKPITFTIGEGQSATDKNVTIEDIMFCMDGLAAALENVMNATKQHVENKETLDSENENDVTALKEYTRLKGIIVL